MAVHWTQHPLLAVLFGGLCVLHLCVEEQGFPLLKVLPMGLLVARAISAPGVPRRAWLVAALIFAAAGDASLVYDGLFLVGLRCFFVSHLLYIGVFGQQLTFDAARGRALTAVLVLILGGACVIVHHLPAELRLWVVSYIGVLAAMITSAFLSACNDQRAAAWGALSFGLSDLTLGTDRFVLQPLPHATLIIMPTYYAAQWLLVQAVLASAPKAARRPYTKSS